jgi:hypothetical protein
VELDEFLSKLDGVEPYGVGQYSARCPAPAHVDVKPSLTVHAGRHGGVVAKCQRGCKIEDVVTGLGLTLADLMGAPYIEAEYEYRNETGKTVYTVERWANPKTFRIRPGLPLPAQRVMYQVDAIQWCRENEFPIYLVEGEKDCETLRLKGIPATTVVGGAGKWQPQYTDALAGLDVIVVADNDEVGVASARSIVEQIRRYARSVALKYSPVGKDVSDLVEAGYTLDALRDLPLEGGAVYVASQIQPKAVRWLWPGHIPYGKVTFIEGDPGDGKSLLTVDLAARLSAGREMPGGAGAVEPVKVALVSGEDDPDDTIVPRLNAAGANLDNVLIVPHGPSPDLPFELARDWLWLRDYCMTHGVGVVVFDPVNAFLGEKTDTHNDSSTRRGLMPLKILASTTGAAVIGVRHLNKGNVGTKAIYRSGGSIAFVGMARAAFLVAPNPRDREVRVLACVKMSLARKPPSLTYTIEGDGDASPRLVWGEAIEATAQDVLDGPEKESDADPHEQVGRRVARLRERAFLYEILQDEPLAWGDIVALGKAEGFSARTLERARNEVLSVESVRLVEVDDNGRSVAHTVWQRKPDWTDTEIAQSDPVPPLLHFASAKEAKDAAEGVWRSSEPDYAPYTKPRHAEAVPESTVETTDSDGILDSATGRSVHSPSPRDRRSGELGEVTDFGDAACSRCGDTENLTMYPGFGWRCDEDNPRYLGEDL